jgi:aryl-alcohol dehydrogenase-like predicted oxidoreductase
MEYGHIDGVKLPISRLVQGTVTFGSANAEESFKLLDAVLAEGCNTFDTAHVYGRGDNERTMGRWIRERGVRDKIVLIGKGAHHSEDRKRVTPFDIEADIHDSLARFGTDFIDIYLLHRDNPEVPVGPIVEALNRQHDAGKIGVFGGSNWKHPRIEEANEYAAKHNLQPFTVSSPNFSLAEQHKEPWPDCITIAGEKGAEAREWYAKQNIALFTWSSFAGGFFSGRFRPDNLDTFSDYFDKVAVNAYCYEDNFQRLERAEELAAERGVTLPQIAVAYVMNQPLNIYALIGARTVEEFRDNAAALDIELGAGELAWLELRAPTV